ncbi:MAG: DNA topoisomerase I, partial [Candidatus Aureabacteria bacterium]|nr:DNA topoisomerase I [Candidatus Auribacterota bacterium]
MKSLVIVESPAKAKTINKILGDSCQVMASGGHIRDLPKKEIGIDIKNEFKPKYVAITKKKDIISKLKKAAVESEKVYLAPDPDREGEAIAWHLSQIMKIPSEKMRRVTFNEITKSAVKKAFESAHDINMNKVNSQQARRILDRIVGYKISPLLWRKLKGSQSAGRVQSVALRLVCEKEKQIEDFNSVKYWDIFAELSKIDNKQNFQAKLLTVDGKKVVQTPKNEDEIAIHDEKGASKIKEELESSKFLITGISKKNIKRNPGPPFTTSLLQQAGVNVLG